MSEKCRPKRHTNFSSVPLEDRAFAMGDPTGFHRSKPELLSILFRMRDKHDIPGRFERMDMMAQTDRAEHWDAHWGRKEGETNAERLERLGEREERFLDSVPTCFEGRFVIVCESWEYANICTFQRGQTCPSLEKGRCTLEIEEGSCRLNRSWWCDNRSELFYPFFNFNLIDILRSRHTSMVVEF